MARSQFVILSRVTTPEGGLGPLGTRRELETALACRNTMSDRPGGDTLYGPGIEVDLSPGEDPVMQMSLTVTDRDIAPAVIARLVQEFQWRIFDDQGREVEVVS
jgi:hypothetical protein